MRDVDEFVAEAFSTPKFQAKLMAIDGLPAKLKRLGAIDFASAPAPKWKGVNDIDSL